MMTVREQMSPSELITSCQGLVRSIAWKIHQRLPRSVELDDLIGYGQVGLAEAARDFDRNRKVQFTTYAYYRVRGAILDGLSSMSWFTKADYARGRYERSANELLTETNEANSGDDVSWFERTTVSLSMSYLMTHYCEESHACEISDPGVPPSEVAEAVDLHDIIGELVCNLPHREQALIRGVYFEGLSIKEAGESIGISKAWASRLHTRVLNSLALGMKDDDDGA
jgi:RNA polymerase sigma factor for flagellar operon FliA